MYYLRILEDLGEYSDAMVQLDSYAKERSIIDKIAIAEVRGVFTSFFFLDVFFYDIP